MFQILLIMLLCVANLFSSDHDQYKALIKHADGYFSIKPFEQELKKFKSVPREVTQKINKNLSNGKDVPFTNFYLSTARHEGRCYQQGCYLFGGIAFAMAGLAAWGLFSEHYPRASLTPFVFSAASFGLWGAVEGLKYASKAHDTRTATVKSLLEKKTV